MGGASGLTLIQAMNELDPATRIVVLTGYTSIATAVEAIKLGATQYLAKPTNADEVVAAFGHQPSPILPPIYKSRRLGDWSGSTSIAYYMSMKAIYP